MNQNNICPNCGSDDIISPRRCSLSEGLKTYCPKCDRNVESKEFYVCHASEKGQKDIRVFICPGCGGHMSDIVLTKEQSQACDKIAREIIDVILRGEKE